ncbi:ribosomal protein S18 acetylase RimI-like enzyme [Pedobacter sp. CG_S7]|uniref:GNAT family N-acetyltransferase n=1 Tax=Pedobacter sp. CG_S7 TaxID=3143930 RepID=UPI003399DFDC
MIETKLTDKKFVIEILSKSFKDNKSILYLTSPNNGSINKLNTLMDYCYDVCSLFGKVCLSDDQKACALILYPHQKRTTLRSIWNDLRLIYSVIGFGRIIKVMRREMLIKKKHSKENMAYLWFIGVDPLYQGLGIGSKLLMEILEDSERKGLPVYLETSTLENLAWYKSFGFQIYDKLEMEYTLFFLKRIPLK